MRIRAWRKSVLAILMAGILLFSVTGCGDWESIALQWLESWADSHDVNPTTPGGAANLVKRTASGSTGDQDADAAIGIFKQFDSIREGDKLIEEGRQLRDSGDLKQAQYKMDEAILVRPNDSSYRVERAAIAFQSDDGKVAYEQVWAGWDIARKNTYENQHYSTQLIDTLESSKFDTSKMSLDTRVAYYEHLERAYRVRHDVTQNNDDWAVAEQYKLLRWELTKDESEAKSSR